MSCIICNAHTNNIYNENTICHNCMEYSLKLEKMYEETLGDNLQFEYPTEIENGLFIGSKLSAISEDKLNELKIKNVVVAGKYINKVTKYKNINYIELLIDDSMEQPILEFIKLSNNFINANKNTNILIYCNSGISRSATIIIGYLMQKHNWNYNDAFNFLKLKYPKAHPNENFKNQLSKYTFLSHNN